MKSGPGWVVFTDLDGSLLDSGTYSFEAARPALDELKRRGAAIVPCTSKTAGETRYFMERLGIQAPYIVEGGGGIHIPGGCFPGMSTIGEWREDGRLIKLAVGYDEVLQGMEEIRQATQGRVLGFHDMTPQRIARESGLSLDLARLAKQREFDEPFLLLDREEAWPADLEARVSRRGLRVSRGGGFWHLHGDTDKGRAVEIVKSFYRATQGSIRTMGIGDSPMDLSMLEVADVRIVIPGPPWTADPLPLRELKHAILARRPGAEGWGQAVLEALSLSA